MSNIDNIIKITVEKEANSTTVRDLNTICILSKHDVFTEDFRIYTDVSDMIEDGFEVTDYAYQAARLAFLQNPRPAKVVVGVVKELDDDPLTYETYVNAIIRTRNATSAWIFLVTDADTDEVKEDIADYVEATIIKYVYSDRNVDTITSATTDLPSLLKAKNYNNSWFIYRKETETIAPEAAYVGRFSSAIAGSNLWLYKPLVGLTPENLTPTEEAFLRSKNGQYYSTINDDPVVVGEGKVAAGEFIDVILGALWIKIRMQENVWNLFKTNSRILYTNAGIAMIETKISETLRQAVVYNILTDDDPIQISVPDANKLSSAQRSTRILTDVTFRARLAGAIQYVDGIFGTLYA